VLITIEEEGIDVLIGQPPTPPKPNPLQAMAPLSDQEWGELDAFLISDATSDNVMMMDCLDGFLTAIVSGPVMVSPSVWLPRVWGDTAKDAPKFKNRAQADHITSLIMRHLNGIIWSLYQDADTFEPVFDSRFIEKDPHEYIDSEMWAYGYICGIKLQKLAWKPFFDDQASLEVLRPIHLLGADDVTKEGEALTITPARREALSKQIPASAVWIYLFWQPYRRAVAEHTIATSYQRENSKIGRNDPCPCGSGKKFKKCCGTSTVLH
jgi:uncharacterized protein